MDVMTRRKAAPFENADVKDIAIKGEVYIVKKSKDFINGVGGSRPAVVISGGSVNKSNRCMVVFLTHQERDREDHVPVRLSAYNTSYAICDNVMTIYQSRLEKYIGSISGEEMAEIDRQIDKCRDREPEAKKDDWKNKPLCIGCPEKAKIKEKDEMIQELERKVLDLKIGRDCYKKMYESILEKIMAR